MELEIQIVRDPCGDEAKQRLRLFGQAGGTIGRSPDSYWALPDPKRYVSGQHCEVEFRDNSFWLRDTSRNGVFINDSTERVGYGHRARLDDGDRLRVGLYELVVRLREHGRLLGSVEREDHQLAKTVSLPAPVEVVQESAKLEHAQPSAAAGARRDHAAAPTGGADQSTSVVGAPAGDWARSSTGSHRLIKLDRGWFRQIGLLPPEPEERLIANQFRQIKRSLLANAFGKGVPAVARGRLIMMTSALPGEGKTFSTINLALSIAREQGVEALVVDADVAKPQVSALFKLEKEAGLLEALANDAVDIEAMVVRTDVAGLSVLPAGRCDGDIATELLASARMEDVIARLGSHNPARVVLFDSPPLLLTNESRVLTTVVGQIVIVVRAGVTPRHAVTEAIGYVGEDRPIGLILNQSTANSPSSYYGYGEYGYGGYGTNAVDPAKSKTE